MTNSPKGIAVITGASTGIGAIYADRLARRGYDLILVARSQDKLEDVAKRVAGATGRNVQAVTADLNDKTDLKRIETLLATEIGITMLVNNAGVGALVSLLESNVDDMETMIELNVTALTRLTVVLPGATATNFWDAAGGSVHQLPAKMVMRGDHLVDAALAGLDQGEFVTIPSLPHAADWDAYEAARQKLIPNLSLSDAPSRYRAPVAA
jgi:uncharacterized protein